VCIILPFLSTHYSINYFLSASSSYGMWCILSQICILSSCHDFAELLIFVFQQQLQMWKKVFCKLRLVTVTIHHVVCINIISLFHKNTHTNFCFPDRNVFVVGLCYAKRGPHFIGVFILVEILVKKIRLGVRVVLAFHTFCIVITVFTQDSSLNTIFCFVM
jgi:hypothetical protein